MANAQSIFAKSAELKGIREIQRGVGQRGGGGRNQQRIDTIIACGAHIKINTIENANKVCWLVALKMFYKVIRFDDVGSRSGARARSRSCSLWEYSFYLFVLVLSGRYETRTFTVCCVCAHKSSVSFN